MHTATFQGGTQYDPRQRTPRPLAKPKMIGLLNRIAIRLFFGKQ